MLQDLRFALRMLVKDPWFTTVAVVALALGIGMNTTVFTFVNAVLIRGLPFEESHQLLHLDVRNTSTGDDAPASWPEFVDWRERATSFSGMAAYRTASFNVSEAGLTPERVAGAFMTADMFRLLRVRPQLGRDFEDADGQANAAPVVLISDALWRSRYGASPDVVGRTVKLSGVACTVVGVMPPDMRFPQNQDIWRPLVPSADLDRRENRSLRLVVRLAPGVSREQAQAEVSGLARPLQQEFQKTNKDIDARLLTFNERFNGGEIRIVFLALLGAVGFVLLIACANVANLLLSRSAKRTREVAIRFALGASRRQVVRQLLIESVLLACLGGAFGLLLAWSGVRAFEAAVATVNKPYWIRFTLDLPVFAYMAGICLATGVIFGIAPALQVTRTNANEILKEGGRGAAGGPRARRMRSALVIAELALTVVLLIGAGLMVRSFLKLYDVDMGIAHADRLLTMRADLPLQKYTSPEMRYQAFERIQAAIGQIPGVAAVAVADTVPFGGGTSQGVEIDGKPVAAGAPLPRISSLSITPGYFDTVGAPILRGRAFEMADGTTGREHVIVNEVFVSRFFQNSDPVGARIRFRSLRDPNAKPGAWLTVVGVSPTIRQGDPQALEPTAVVYQPYRQLGLGSMAIMVRAADNPVALTTAVRQAVQATDPDLPVHSVRTMNEQLGQVRWMYQVFGSMFAIFALVALALSAVGIYAVTSYAVTQRTAEIGVRMALGAAPKQVWWLILRQGIVQLAWGLGLGLAAGWPLSGALQSIVVQISPQDPVTFAGITLLLAVVMLVSCLVPARRATRLDPLTALRVE